jgi:YidC/Oxa1 family membrane protein insertase
MDKQATLGFVLIAIILMVWMWYNTPQPRPPQIHTDTTGTVHTPTAKSPDSVRAEHSPPPAPAQTPLERFGEFFSPRAAGQEKLLTINTDLYSAEITTKGGLIRRWELKNYKTWNQYPVQLVDLTKGGEFGLLFISSDGKEIDTRNLYFDLNMPASKIVTLSGADSLSVDLVLPVREGKRIVKRLTFTGNKYTLDAEILFQNMADVIGRDDYEISWENALPYAEHNSIDESSYATAFGFSGGETVEVDELNEGEPRSQNLTGQVDWVAARNKYFAVALLPDQSLTTLGASISGERHAQPDRGEKETYALRMKMPLTKGATERSKVTVFLGPLDFTLIKSLDRGLDHIMSLGAAWIIRPITEYVMIPLFNVLHLFIANWGVVIIVFSIIIKIALHPLTRSSMKSMKKMQQLQPMMNEIREKYKENPEQMNKAIMNLYKDYGVNPAGGCLPLLLQMPILYALYNVFSSTIQLRQAHFVGWIHDLSIPDSVLHLPFTIPLFGITELSGLALAMCITMFIQQKQTVTDPRQKAMVWMMPIMMMLIFNNLPSGLNLYYFVFNLLSIGQQIWINKQHGNEPLRKVDPKKASGGLIGRLAKNLPDMKR